MIQLQAQLYHRTGVWLPATDLWERIGGMFDLDQLDSMVCHNFPFEVIIVITTTFSLTSHPVKRRILNHES